LEPEVAAEGVVGSRGPLIGAAGVVSMTVCGSSGLGRAWVSTYRGRPPGHEELREVTGFNMTNGGKEPALQWAETTLDVHGRSVPGQLAFVPASVQVNIDRWAVLLFGKEYSASIQLEGMTPEQLTLTMKNDDAGHTDLRTALAHHP